MAGVEHPRRSGGACARLPRALERGWAVLTKGGSAIDACEAATIELENDPIFDAASART
jgi:beta-aspartyl-peptidase (threonine type)